MKTLIIEEAEQVSNKVLILSLKGSFAEKEVYSEYDRKFGDDVHSVSFLNCFGDMENPKIYPEGKKYTFHSFDEVVLFLEKEGCTWNGRKWKFESPWLKAMYSVALEATVEDDNF